MSLFHDIQKLPEKLEQADLVAFGYKWGKKDGVIDLARQIHAAIAIHGNIIKGISEIITPYINETRNNGGKND